MKPRATLLAFLTLAFLSAPAAASLQPKPAAPNFGSYERTLLLKKTQAKKATVGFGSVQRRALLSNGKLPKVPKLPSQQKKPTRRGRF
jgi:hypothetical protein